MRLVTGKKVADIGRRLSTKGFGAAVFVCSGALEDRNVQYLTGLSGVQGGAVVLRNGHVFLLVNGLDYDRAISCATADEIIKAEGQNLAKMIVERCKGVKTVGCVKARLTSSAADALKRKGLRMKDIGDIMDEERACKEPEEIEALEKCARIANNGIKFLGEHLDRGLRENDVAAELERKLKMLGSERAPFETIVSSGKRSAFIHPSPSATSAKMGKGLGLVDFGATFQGYVCDVTVPLMIGKPSPRQEKIASAVMSAAGDIEKMLSPGTSTADIYGAFKERLLAAGLEVKHSAGHGIGLEVHEHPSLSEKPSYILREGMALAVEPGAYVPGVGGFRIENDFIITKNGGRKLTKSNLIRLLAKYNHGCKQLVWNAQGAC
jgi:Xaa-Pro aminopeptidase